MCAASFHHVGLSVPDLDRSRAFYEQALGMREQFAFEVADPDIRGAVMETDGGARIELLERADSARAGTWPDPPAAILAQGYGHWALAVEDLESACARMLGAGAEMVWDPRDAPEPGSRMAYLRDPDGNLVELIAPSA